MAGWVVYASDNKTRSASDIKGARKIAQEEANRTGRSAIAYPTSRSGSGGGRKAVHVSPKRNPRGRRSNAGGPLDTHAARELELFISNDSQLYNSQERPIQKNLILKKAKGIYKHDLAVKLYGYLMTNGAKKYAKEFGVASEWMQTFSPATRKAAAQEFAKSFEVEADLGNYDNYLPEKYKHWRVGKNPTPVRVKVKGKVYSGMAERNPSTGKIRIFVPPSVARKINPMFLYDVYLNGKKIDTVTYSTKQDVSDVKRSLVNHDGYDSGIVVKLRRK